MSLPVLHKDPFLPPLLFFCYINELSDGLQINPKLFVDDTSLFIIVQNIIKAINDLNNDLKKSTKRAVQWFHPPLTFNIISVAQTNFQNHLGTKLHKELNFKEHFSKVESKVNKTIGIIRKLQNVLLRLTLVTIYKVFIRPQLDYGDTIYAKGFNYSFRDKLESLQYNATVAIIGAIRVPSTQKNV